MSFFGDLALGTDAPMTFGPAGKMLVFGFLGCLLTAMLYGKDWLCNVKFLMEVEDKHGRKARVYEDSSDEEDDAVRFPSDQDGSNSDSSGGKKKGKRKMSVAMSGVQRGRFDDLDKDGDGQISKKEMKRAGLTQGEMDALDGDGNGKVTLKEFKKAANKSDTDDGSASNSDSH
jgi:hypothetical protein